VTTPLWITGGMFIIALLAFGVNVIASFRRMPPLDRELGQYAKKEDLHRHREEWRNDMREVREELHEGQTRLHERLDKVGAEIGESYERLQRSDEARSRNLHQRLNSFGSAIDKLTGAFAQLPCNRGNGKRLPVECPSDG